MPSQGCLQWSEPHSASGELHSIPTHRLWSRWWSRRTCNHLLLQLSAAQPLTGECWIPRKKDTLHPRAKETPSQDDRSALIAFRIKPHTHQRCSEGSNNTLCTTAPREPTEAKPDLPSCRVTPAEVWVSSGLPQGQGLWVQQTRVTHHVA